MDKKPDKKMADLDTTLNQRASQSTFKGKQGIRTYIGVGSNMNAEKNIAKAIDLMEQDFGDLDISPHYLNPAQGFDGDDFVNLVVGFWYEGSIRELKKRLKVIERHCGRVRENEFEMNSRAMDLDLLTFGDLKGVYDGLELPRKDVYEREFVRLPLRNLLCTMNELSEFEKDLLSIVQL